MQKSDNVIELSKLERQLLLFEIFSNFYEYELETITEILPVERRTLQRDVKDLMDAGLIHVKFSSKHQAYEKIDRHCIFYGDVEHPTRDKRLKKLKRLGNVIAKLSNDEVSSGEKFERKNYKTCKDYYVEMFPDISARTMERDFVTLNRIGYPIKYDRELRYYRFYDGTTYRTDFGVFRKNGKLYRELGVNDFEEQYLPEYEMKHPEFFDEGVAGIGNEKGS